MGIMMIMEMYWNVSISMGTSLRMNIHLQRSWSTSAPELLLSPVAFQVVSRISSTGSLPETFSMHQGLNGDHTNNLAPGIFDRLTLCIQRLLRLHGWVGQHLPGFHRFSLCHGTTCPSRTEENDRKCQAQLLVLLDLQLCNPSSLQWHFRWFPASLKDSKDTLMIS